MALHWHFARITSDTSKIPDDYVGLDVFFALDRFPTTHAAAQAIADDIVKTYPQAKTHRYLARVPTVFADNPGSAFYYHPNHPNKDVMAVWNMTSCDGDCRTTYRTFAQQARDFMERRVDLPIMDV